jgi:hypothetical protein
MSKDKYGYRDDYTIFKYQPEFKELSHIQRSSFGFNLLNTLSVYGTTTRESFSKNEKWRAIADNQFKPKTI